MGGRAPPPMHTLTHHQSRPENKGSEFYKDEPVRTAERIVWATTTTVLRYRSLNTPPLPSLSLCLEPNARLARDVCVCCPFYN